MGASAAGLCTECDCYTHRMQCFFTLFHIGKRAKGGRRTNEIKFWEQGKYVRIGELRETTMWMSKRDNKLKSNCCARNSRRWHRMCVASRIELYGWLKRKPTAARSIRKLYSIFLSISIWLLCRFNISSSTSAASVSLQCSYEPCPLFDFFLTQWTWSFPIFSRYANLFSIKYFSWASGSCDKSPATGIRNMICFFWLWLLGQSFSTLFLFDCTEQPWGIFSALLFSLRVLLGVAHSLSSLGRWLWNW